MTLILDFDGTLGDTRAIIVKTMSQTLAALGYPNPGEDTIAGTIGLPLVEAFRQMLGVDEAGASHCSDVYHRLFDENNRPGTVPAFPGVVDTLRRLHAAGHVLTIASSRGRQSLLDFVSEMRLDDVITMIVSANDVAHAKPAPDMVLKILGETHTPAAEALVVGDTCFDIDMGRAAGVSTCAVTYGNGHRADFTAADYVIDRFSQLCDIVKG